MAIALGFRLGRTTATAGAQVAPAAKKPPPVGKRKVAAKDPITIADVGDMTFGFAGAPAPGGAGALLAAVKPKLQSDLTVGNLETTLGAGGSEKCGANSTSCFSFQAPADTAVALRGVGFDAVNVANNHADDYGADGIAQTDAALNAAGLPYTGRPGQTTYVVGHGVKIALLGFAPYPYDANLLNIPAAEKRVREAAANADVVIVFIHAGAEGADYQHVRPGTEMFLGENRGDAIRFAHAVVDAGADLVLGSGPHVLRAMEWYHERLIAYSLGNFSGYHTLNVDGVTGTSGILRLTLAADGSFHSGTLVPIRLVGDGTPEPDPDRSAIATVNELSRSDFPSAGVRLHADGVIQDGAATK